MAIDMTGRLPAAAEAALGEYLAALDDALAERARGVYVTGSAVLGDWQADRSDLDILVVTESVLDDGELDALEELHAAISGRPYRDAVYFPSAAVGSRDEGIAYPAAIDGVFHRARHRPTRNGCAAGITATSSPTGVRGRRTSAPGSPALTGPIRSPPPS